MINILFRQVELSETYLSLLSVAWGDKSINNVLFFAVAKNALKVTLKIPIKSSGSSLFFQL